MIYAGLGVVEGSDPALEWQELELKASQVCAWALHPIIYTLICSHHIFNAKMKFFFFISIFPWYNSLVRAQFMKLMKLEASPALTTKDAQ